MIDYLYMLCNRLVQFGNVSYKMQWNINNVENRRGNNIVPCETPQLYLEKYEEDMLKSRQTTNWDILTLKKFKCCHTEQDVIIIMLANFVGHHYFIKSVIKIYHKLQKHLCKDEREGKYWDVRCRESPKVTKYQKRYENKCRFMFSKILNCDVFIYNLRHIESNNISCS